MQKNKKPVIISFILAFCFLLSGCGGKNAAQDSTAPADVLKLTQYASLIGMTKAAARELGSRGITVNAVAPGYIETDMTAALPAAARDAMKEKITLKRAGTPEDVAGAVAFLASEDADYITGQVLVVDGGMAF